MRIVGYVRLSRASREESTSVVRQRELIVKTCAARGFELVEIAEDVDVSATKSRLVRPGLARVRELIREDRADAVMVWRLDRLVRSVVDLGVLLDEGLQIISATESLDTTSAMGRAMVEILQVFASMESKTAGLRISASQEHLRKNGRWPGGVRPYGYRAVTHPSGVGRALEPDPVEAPIVRRMADEALAGKPVYQIALGLNEDGIAPRRAENWNPTSVQRILRSNSVLGRVKVKGELLRDDNGVPVEQWEPLLTVDEVERLRALTDWTPTPGRSEATKAGKRNRVTRLLSGLLPCPTCGKPLIVRRRQANTIYACMTRARGGDCSRGAAVDADLVEREVERRFLSAIGRLEAVEPREYVRPVAGLAAVEEAIRDTTDALRDPDADVTALVTRLNALRMERERMDELPTTPVIELVSTGELISEVWQRYDFRQRRDLILSSGVEIDLAPAKRRGFWDPSRVSLHFTS